MKPEFESLKYLTPDPESDLKPLEYNKSLKSLESGLESLKCWNPVYFTQAPQKSNFPYDFRCSVSVELIRGPFFRNAVSDRLALGLKFCDVYAVVALKYIIR